MRSGTSFGGSTIISSSNSQIGRFDSSGNVQWFNSYDVNAEAIATDSDNNIYVTGYYQGTTNLGGDLLSSVTPGYDDVFLVSYNSDGVHRWSRNAGGPNNDLGYTIDTDNLGNVYVGGKVEFAANLGSPENRTLNIVASFISSYSTSDGSYNWDQIYDGENSQIVTGLGVSASGNVTAVGYYESTNSSEACDFGGSWPLPIGVSSGSRNYLFTLSLTP